jgi:plastocyanin
MVAASKKAEAVNQEWGKNAKNRSTHNTYFTLPVIFIMLSNHFPQTYGHEYNWLLLLLISLGGAAIREYFVTRLQRPGHALLSASIGMALIIGVAIFSREKAPAAVAHDEIHSHAAPVKETKGPQKAPSPVAGKTVNIKGSISFEGTPPVGKKLNLPAACAKQFKGDAYSNEVIINNGKMENVLVRIVKGLEGMTFPDVPEEEVELDQRGCIYQPRVIGARVGQKITFINSDPLFHNVRSVTTVNQKFNMAMPHKDQRETKVFDKAEIFMQTKCSVHPWMGAYIAIMDHPFFSISNAKGEYHIKDLPVGNYTIEAWHEVYGIQTREITVTEQGISDLNFTFSER